MGNAELDAYLLGMMEDDADAPYLLGEDDDLEGLGYDDLGYDDLGFDEEELGAVIRAARSGGMSRAMMRKIRALKPSKFPGSPPRALRTWPLPFPVANFVNAGPTSIQLTARPQRVFKGKRLVLDIARSGATSTGLVTVSEISVGAVDQRIAINPLPAGAFAPNAVRVGLNLDPAEPGIEVTIEVTLGAPALGVGDTVDVSPMLLGTSLS